MGDIAAIERRLDALYRDGHRTGYGAGGPMHPDCAPCQEARALSHRWDDHWRRFEEDRLARMRRTET